MDWLGIGLLVLIIVLVVALGIMIVCMVTDQGCTISCQKRSTNSELTKKKQEEEEKKRNKPSSRIKRAFKSSSKDEQPSEVVQDVKSWEIKLKPGDGKKDSKEITTIDEPLIVPVQPVVESPAEREARLKRDEERRKRHEAIRQKYNL